MSETSSPDTPGGPNSPSTRDHPSNNDSQSADPGSAEGQQAKWHRISTGGHLSLGPVPVGPGNVPTGGDLSLEIGWERFEQLLVHICSRPLALGGLMFRRYGTPGQAQHGIDLAGRHDTGTYSVVQCKHVGGLSPAQLRAAVELYANGRRPFDATHFIVAVNHPTRTTQLEDELANLQDEHADLTIELWGSEQINDILRDRGDIVGRFWTRETAATFCTGAPLPGVPAEEPEWRRLAEQVSLTPLGDPDVDVRLRQAEQLQQTDPGTAADVYGEIADAVAAERFTGHAHTLRRRQLTALQEAGRLTHAAELAAQLAADALHAGDTHSAWDLRSQLDRLAQAAAGTPDHSAVQHHRALITAALNMVEHPLGDNTSLRNALEGALAAGEDRGSQGYEPVLTLLLLELTLSDTLLTPSGELTAGSGPVGRSHQDVASDAAAALEDLVTAALEVLAGTPTLAGDALAFRLALGRACYDLDTRTRLVSDARSLRLPRSRAAIVLAAQARRDTIAALPDEAAEKYRLAVNYAIEDGRTDLARGWLYAIRNIKTHFGPLTDRINDDHYLASALPADGQAHVLGRTRDLELVARRAAMDAKPREAINAARRWLADSILLGDWADEAGALELLGDCYATNASADRAACAYQLGGEGKKLEQLAEACGDHLLPILPLQTGSVWQQTASLQLLRTQDDLLDDAVAAAALDVAVTQHLAGERGELIDGVFGNLATGAAKTAGLLAARGTGAQATAYLAAMEGSVARSENQYRFHDKEHVTGCLRIIERHADVAVAALERVFSLAELGTSDALDALNDVVIMRLLDPTWPDANTRAATLTDERRNAFIEQLQQMAEAGDRYRAGIAYARIGGVSDTITAAATAAETRILTRPEPDGVSYAMGAPIAQDAFLVRSLDPSRQVPVLRKLQRIAKDRREAAANRHDALNAATVLVHEMADEELAGFHVWSRPFADGEEDGSMLDDMLTNPHPLSAFKASIGQATLVGAGIDAAATSARSDDEKVWVRARAAALLAETDRAVVSQAAVVLSRLGAATDDIDPQLLTGHPIETVRQLAAFLATEGDDLDAALVTQLAGDSSPRVRRLLAERLHRRTLSRGEEPNATAALAMLRADPRHTIRTIFTTAPRHPVSDAG